jgi:hypothetical protein
MARGGAIAVNIITTFDAGDIQKAQKELQRLSESIKQPGDGLKDLGAKFQSAGKSISDVGKGITKSVGAVSAAFIALGVSSIKAAAQAEAEQNRLRQVLLATGLASEEQIKALNAQAKALENLGVVSAKNVTVTQSQLATFDLQAETIERLTPAILDYVTAEKGAAASADDFKSMTNGLAQALQGNFASLTKTGFVLDETTKNLIKNGTEAQRSAALVDVLNSTYQGFNATLRDTTEGRLQVLRNSFDDLRTRIGDALLPVMESFTRLLSEKLVPAFDKIVTKFENLTDGQRNAVIGLTLFGAVLGPTIILVGSLTTAVGSLTIAMGALRASAAKTGIVLSRVFVIGAIVAAAIFAIVKFREQFPLLDKAISYSGAFLKTFFASVTLLGLRFLHVLVSIRKALIEAATFGFGDTSKLEKQLSDIEAEAWKLSATIDGAMAKAKHKAVLATEALRDQATAQRGLNVEVEKGNKGGGGGGGGGLTKEQIEALKKRAQKLKEQAKALREINLEFAAFAKASNAPEASISSLLVTAESNLKKFQNTANNSSLKTDRLIERLKNLAETIKTDLNAALDLAKQKLVETQNAYDNFAKEISNSIRGIVNFGSAFTTAQNQSKAAVDALAERIAAQTERLNEAKKTLQDYAGGISKAISGTLNFGKAFETAGRRGQRFFRNLERQASNAETFAIQIRELVARGLSREALEQVIGAGDAGSAIAKRLLAGGAETIDRANDLVLSLRRSADEVGQFVGNRFYSAGVSSAQSILDGLSKEVAQSTSFIDALNKQADNATLFAEKVRKLISMGLSKSAIREVLAAGSEAGTLIADSIIAGGQTVVTQINKLVASVEEVADAVGQDAADAFYKSGIDLAKEMVQGILDQINASAAAIAAALAAAAAGRKLPVNIPTDGTKPSTIPSGNLGKTAEQIGLPLAQLQAELAAQVAQNKNIANRLAQGGLGATAAARLKDKLEVGRLSAADLRTDIRTFDAVPGNTQSNTINISVNAGMGTDGAQVGEEIISAIKKYERISGPVFMSAI